LKEQKKKRFIAILLLVSCFISGYMLFAASDGSTMRLRNLAQADSLIQKELYDFNISDQQIRVTTTRVDSNFSRKTYRVGLPYQFSKTQFHAELNSRLHSYGVETPAQVTFPEKNVDIHLLYRGTVIRTISLQTDPELLLDRNEASLLVSFDDFPDEELISTLASLGEPIPIVLKIETPIQANELRKRLGDRYNHLLFWLKTSSGKDLIKENPSAARAKLKQLEEVLPQARILQYEHADAPSEKLIAQTDLTFINAGDALLLHEDLGKASFFEELNKLRSNRNHSMAVITGNETTLTWLEEKLPELKKAGIEIVPPPQMNY